MGKIDTYAASKTGKTTRPRVDSAGNLNLALKTQVVYLHDADREAVDKLVADYGATLIALAAANQKRGRSEQAFLPIDGIILAVVTYRHAEELGLQLPQKTLYVVLAMPADSETARSIIAHVNTADSGSMMLDVSDLSKSLPTDELPDKHDECSVNSWPNPA